MVLVLQIASTLIKQERFLTRRSKLKTWKTEVMSKEKSLCMQATDGNSLVATLLALLVK